RRGGRGAAARRAPAPPRPRRAPPRAPPAPPAVGASHARRRRGAPAARSTAASSASIDGHRALRSVASPRSTLRTSPRGTPRRSRGGGAPARTAATRSSTLLPPYGRSPNSASYIDTQNEN